MTEEATAWARVGVVVIGNAAHLVVDEELHLEVLVDDLRQSVEHTALISSGGFGSCCFQTTIGTEHDSHSATQQTSSS